MRTKKSELLWEPKQLKKLELFPFEDGKTALIKRACTKKKPMTFRVEASKCQKTSARKGGGIFLYKSMVNRPPVFFVMFLHGGGICVLRYMWAMNLRNPGIEILLPSVHGSYA